MKQLGDHPGIPLLFSVRTKEFPVSLVLKFHGDSKESLTIYKAAKRKEVSDKTYWNGIFYEMADALEHIHRCGYVHNDLKSNNVVLEKREDERLHPVIIDFGKSVAVNKAKSPVTKPKHAKELYRNSYVAPELVDGTGKPSVASDAFVLAFLVTTVYVMLKFDNLSIVVKQSLAKSPSNRPPVSAIKHALSVED